MRVRKDPEERRIEILSAAVELAAERHFESITRAEIAERAGCSERLITYYLGDMEIDVPEAILVWAIETENYTVIAQGIIARHPTIEDLDPTVKKRALAAYK